MNGNELSPSLQDLANQLAAQDPRFRLQLPLNPYEGVLPNDPLWQYTFGPPQPEPPLPPRPQRPPSSGDEIYERLGQVTPHFDESLQGTVEQRGPMSEYDAFMAWLGNQNAPEMAPTRPPGRAAPHPVKPGSLEQQAGQQNRAPQQPQQRQPQQQSPQQPQQQQPPWPPLPQPSLSWPPSQEAPMPWPPQ
jgi:hypothetical protein